MNKLGSGGGSNKLNQSKAPKVEPRSKAVSPEAVAQLGASTAFQKKPLDMGPGLGGPVGPTNNLVNGPKGQGRNLHHCGSQSLHGAVNQGESPRSEPRGLDVRGRLKGEV